MNRACAPRTACRMRKRLMPVSLTHTALGDSRWVIFGAVASSSVGVTLLLRRATSARKEFECPYKHRGPLIITQRRSHISLSVYTDATGRSQIPVPSHSHPRSVVRSHVHLRSYLRSCVKVSSSSSCCSRIRARARTCTRARNSRARQLTHTQVAAE
jgi:hypothetical protein